MTLKKAKVHMFYKWRIWSV